MWDTTSKIHHSGRVMEVIFLNQPNSDKNTSKMPRTQMLGGRFVAGARVFFLPPPKKLELFTCLGHHPDITWDIPHFGQLQAVEERTQILQLWWGMKGYRVKIVRPQARPKPSRPENGTRFQFFYPFRWWMLLSHLGDVRVATAFLEWRDVASFYPEETNAYKCFNNSNRYPYKTSGFWWSSVFDIWLKRMDLKPFHVWNLEMLDKSLYIPLPSWHGNCKTLFVTHMPCHR